MKLGGVKTLARNVLVGMGAAAVFGPTVGAGLAFVSGAGIVGAGAAFFGDQLRSTAGGVTGGLNW